MPKPYTSRAVIGAVTVAALALYSASSVAAQTTIKQLRDAIDAADIDAIERLFASGAATVDTLIDNEGNTPLHLAAERCHPAVVRYLVKRGAKSNLANRWNDTPWRVAVVRCGRDSWTVRAFDGP